MNEYSRINVVADSSIERGANLCFAMRRQGSVFLKISYAQLKATNLRFICNKLVEEEGSINSCEGSRAEQEIKALRVTGVRIDGQRRKTQVSFSGSFLVF